MLMLLELVLWWYGRGWSSAWKATAKNTKLIQQMFSLPVLLRTLFYPWKQITAVPGRSLDEKFRAMIDNLVSRTIGFFVRLLTLFAALGAIVLVFTANLIIAAAWPLVPLAIIYLIFRGVVG